MSAPKVIATARSKGGRLACGHRADRDDTIYKIDTGARGGSTSAGQGLGAWVCGACAFELEDE